MTAGQASAIAMILAGWTSTFVAGRCRESAALSLSWERIRVPQDLHTWHAGKNLGTLKELYKAELPKGKKMKVASGLDIFGLTLVFVGLLLSWFTQ